MEKYDPKKQSGDLTGAIDKAKEKRSKKPSKKKIALIGAGLVVFGGFAFSSCSIELPAHEERVTYIKENMYDDKSFTLRLTSPYFHISVTSVQDDEYNEGEIYLSNGLIRPSALPLPHLKVAGFTDTAKTDEGTIDEVLIGILSPIGIGACELDYDKLPKSLQGRLDNHYMRVSKSTYMSLKGSWASKIAFRGGLNNNDWKDLLRACDEQGQEIDLDNLDPLPETDEEMGLVELLDYYLESKGDD